MSAEEFLLRRILVTASGVLYWAGVLVQARRVRKRIGRSPNLRPTGAKERGLWITWFLVISAWIAGPLFLRTSHQLWLNQPVLLNSFAFVAGCLCLGVGFAGTIWCYVALGDNWRIGVKPGEVTPLVQRGPYARIRHPIYAFQVCLLLGCWLLLPTTLFALALLGHLLGVHLKAADEERHLRQVHGTGYSFYCARTGRLWPRLW